MKTLLTGCVGRKLKTLMQMIPSLCISLVVKKAQVCVCFLAEAVVSRLNNSTSTLPVFTNFQGYVLCNLDKLVVGLLQNLYRASADKVFNKLTQLYYYEQATQSQGISPAVYRNHAQDMLCHSEREVKKAVCVRSFKLTLTLLSHSPARLLEKGGALHSNDDTFI